MNKVTIRNKYSKKIHLAFYKFHMFRKSTRIYFVMAIGVFVLYLAVRNTMKGDLDKTNLLILWSLASFTVLLTPIIMITKTYSIVTQESKERKETLETLEFTKDKIVRKVETVGSVVIGWYDIQKAYETKDAFYLYISNEQGIVVVKDAIVQGDVETLRSLINKCMKPNKKGKVPYKKCYKDVK